jgi:hypothetical protein
MKRLLREAWMQTKEKLTALYKAVVEGTYRLERKRLYAPDGTWIYVIGNFAPRIPIHGVSASTLFPDVLKLPRERLELLQLGWRASDEGSNKGRPFMITTQPWQVFAWTAARCGELYIHVESINLTHERISVSVHFRANSWRQKWGKLLDLLKVHKWIYIKLATDDGFRAAYKLNKKRSIDVLRETYRRNNGETPTVSHTEADKPGAVAVAGVVMHLELVSGRGGSLVAKYFTRDLEKALAAAERLESAGLRPNIVRSNANYVVYIATADLLKLAERDETIRKATALYLADKVKNGTPRQREIAEKILKRIPLFQSIPFCFFEAGTTEVGVFGRRP